MSETPGQNSSLTRSNLLARNAYINLVGQVIPILVAIVSIPLLIKVLGQERFGVLALAWVVMGYFGVFDFGMSRATTKFVSEHYARDEAEPLSELVWSSVVLHIFLGLLGGAVLAVITPWLTGSVLNIPGALLTETRVSFYLLAVSVPFIVATAALRGVLEAVQRFDLVNLVKVPASVLSYLGPLLVLYFVRGLVAVVGFLVLTRVLVLLVHIFFCLRALPVLSRRPQLNASRMVPLLSFGGWLAVSSFVGPLVASIDRFMIGAFVSLSAVTLYTTPYEVVSKLTIFSASLLPVLFPAFSAMALNRAHELRRLYLRALKYLLVLIVPIVGGVLALAYELLSLWVTPDFAVYAAPIAQWLAVGILVGALAQAPLTVLQGMGRADVTAKIQLIQVPFYVAAVWYSIELAGVVGVAVAWTLRMALVGVALFIAANKFLPFSTERQATQDGLSLPVITIICGFLLICLSSGSLLPESLLLKFAAVGVLLALFSLWEWLSLLNATDRKAFTKGFRRTTGAKQ